MKNKINGIEDLFSYFFFKILLLLRVLHNSAS